MSYTGTIIEESLEDKNILKHTKILNTVIEPIEEAHQTPWLEQWTLHEVEIPDDQAEEIARELSHALDSKHEWYADYKNDKTHYIIFKNKIFKIDRTSYKEYFQARIYGISLGIPEYQVNFVKNLIQ